MTRYSDLKPPLDAAAQLIAGAPTTMIPGRPASAYLPTPEWLRDEILASRIQPKPLIEQMQAALKPRWEAFAANGDGFSRLRGIKNESDAAIGAFDPPNRFDPVWSNLAFRLRVDLDTTARGGRVGAEELLMADGSDFQTKLDRITDTPERAAEAIMMLRQIDDVLIRVGAARTAAAATGRPLAEVLAFYRREGNLCVFPSQASIEQGIPAWVRDNDRLKASERARDDFPFERTLIGLIERPDISYLTWLANPTRSAARAEGAPIERHALATTFLVQPAGFDKIGGRWVPNPNPDLIVDAFAGLSAEWWDRAGMAPGLRQTEREADARGRWAAMESELVLTRNFRGLSGSEPAVHKIAPRDPEALLAAVLTEGVAFFDWHRHLSTLTGTSSAKSFGPAFTALRYNCHATPRLVPGVLVSALFNAQRHRNSALWERFKDDRPLLDFLQGVKQQTRAGRTSAQVQDLQEAAASPNQETVRPELATWLAIDRNREALDDYIRTTGTDVWSAYAIKGKSPRIYAWSFLQLRDFYATIFPTG